MENGRSPVLGSNLSESEGTELMEGATAAVGRQQSQTPSLHHISPRIVASDCFLFLFLEALWSFRCQVRVRVNRTTPKNPQRSPLCIRLTALNQRSPDLLRYTNNLLRYHPNPSPGYLITLQVSLSLCTLITACVTLYMHM